MAGNIDTAQINEALRQAADEARRLATAHSQLVSQITGDASNARTAAEQANRTQEQQNRLDEEANEIKKEYLDLAAEEADAIAKLTALQEKANKLAAEGNQHTQEYIDTIKQVNEAAKAAEEASDKSSAALNDLNQKTGKFGKGVDFAKASVRLFGAALSAQAGQLAAQYKASGGVVEGSGNILVDLLKQQTEAIKQGVSGEELAAESKAHRQTINAMGGTSQALEQLGPSLTQFQALTGSASEGLKETLASSQDLAKRGIKPSASAMASYVKDQVQLTKYTGLSGQAARDFYNTVAEDVESIDILRSAREGERDAILQSQRALIQQSLAAGMSAEQAQNAAKMLNKMVAAKPLDRLKQAAKIRALGAAMGVAGSEEAAQAVTAGKRATPEQKAALQQFNQNMTNKMDESAGQGLGTELFATQLADKLGLEEQYGKGSPFSTSLGDSLKPTEKAIDAFHDTFKGGLSKLISGVAVLSGAFGVFTSGKFWGGAIAAALGVALFKGKLGNVLGQAIGGLGKKGAGGLLGKGTDVLTGGLGGGPGGAGGGGLLKKAAGWGGKALMRGGAGFLVGEGAEMGANALKESGHEKLGAGASIAGKTASYALMGSALGPLGALAGGALGAGMGLYENWDGLFGGDKNKDKEAQKIAEGAQATPDKKAQLQQFNKNASNNLNQAANGSLGTELFNSEQGGKSSSQGIDTPMMLALTSTADGITQQTLQMDLSNTILQQLADASAKQIELAEKQLIALTLTDKEKTESANRANLRADSKFGSQYGYV